MTSLLQFQGDIKAGKVGLQFIYEDESLGSYHCEQCGRLHQIIHVAYRRPRGMLGCWVVFEYCGEKHVPDLSIPIRVNKMPRDAVALFAEESSKIWHT